MSHNKHIMNINMLESISFIIWYIVKHTHDSYTSIYIYQYFSNENDNLQ